MSDWTGNYNSIFKTLGASNHTEKEREENDYYATDPIAIDKLLSVEKLNDKIWECACGEGHLANRLKQFGYDVVSTDIIDRNNKVDKIVDFLLCENLYPDRDILTNPPYKYAKDFCLKALSFLGKNCSLYMFLKLTFLEGKTRYKELFSKFPPKTVYVFSERVLCAKNGEFEKMKQSGGSAVAYAWFVWQKDFQGETIIKWI